MFAKGMGTQVMHKKQKVGATSSHHMMLELARSLLNGGELKTFSYYLNQYESERIGVDDLVTALLRLLDSDEKVHFMVPAELHYTRTSTRVVCNSCAVGPS